MEPTVIGDIKYILPFVEMIEGTASLNDGCLKIGELGIGWEPRPGLGHTYQFISYDIITMVEISHDVKKMIIENQPVIYLELMDEDCRNRAEKKRNKQDFQTLMSATPSFSVPQGPIRFVAKGQDGDRCYRDLYYVIMKQIGVYDIIKDLPTLEEMHEPLQFDDEASGNCVKMSDQEHDKACAQYEDRIKRYGQLVEKKVKMDKGQTFFPDEPSRHRQPGWCARPDRTQYEDVPRTIRSERFPKTHWCKPKVAFPEVFGQFDDAETKTTSLNDDEWK